MGLDVAIDELYASGWSAVDESECDRHSDGRCYPTPDRVIRESKSLGYSLRVRHIQLFDCFRAEWLDDSGRALGAVVGQTEAETTVYALSQLRRFSVAAV
ncbi:MAG: hypothetical protein H6811_04145 [Phycisphaeraceae bacterium]|nr:hypothetical protein [Phycisphaeraceae bacterium]